MMLRSLGMFVLVSLTGCPETGGVKCTYDLAEGATCRASCECLEGYSCAPEDTTDITYSSVAPPSADEGVGGVDCAVQYGVCTKIEP